MSAQGNVTSSWGGSIVEHGGLYHMFAAEMANGCKLNSFLTNSVCIHATSLHPVGPFEKQSTVVGAYCHNPAITLRPYPNGSALWVLFHVADVGTDRGPPKNCSHPGDLPAVAKSSGANTDTSPQHYALSPAGPWRPIPLTGAMAACNNPAPFVHRNGTFYVVCRPDYQMYRTDDVLSGVWMAVSNLTNHNGSNWREWGLPGQLDGHYEDPVMWVDDGDNFHVISHVYRMGPDAKVCTAGHDGAVVSGHYFSPDGHRETPAQPSSDWSSLSHDADNVCACRRLACERRGAVREHRHTPLRDGRRRQQCHATAAALQHARASEAAAGLTRQSHPPEQWRVYRTVLQWAVRELQVQLPRLYECVAARHGGSAREPTTQVHRRVQPASTTSRSAVPPGV
jgi:hypothetical protein